MNIITGGLSSCPVWRKPVTVPAQIEAEELAAAVDDRSARGIAGAVGRLIRSGRLTPGTRLPTVRTLAGALGASPTTVSEAWQILAGMGAVRARGRAGTFVLDG